MKRLVDSAQIYLAWDWNPDGWRYVFDVDNSWRKNRFPNPDGPSKNKSKIRVPLLASRTLNAAGQYRVTLSLR